MTVELSAHPAVVPLRSGRAPDRVPAQKDVVILQYGGEAASAQLLEVLRVLGIAPQVRGVSGAGDFPEPGSVHAAILIGTQSAEDAVAAGWLEAELDWVRRADEAGAALLGIGHGARLLAVAFGGRLIPSRRPLRGWALVDTEIPHLVAAGPWLTWQHDAITLPADARVLAHNRLGPQVFQLGRHIGVQFHPEATPQAVAGWAARTEGAVDVDALLHATARDATAAAACTRRLLSTFVDLIV